MVGTALGMKQKRNTGITTAVRASVSTLLRELPLAMILAVGIIARTTVLIGEKCSSITSVSEEIVLVTVNPYTSPLLEKFLNPPSLGKQRR